jgi:hypothetical protein
MDGSCADMLSLTMGAVRSLDSLSDEALASAARQDREAFLILYDRYVLRIGRYVAARTGSADVEDIVSSVVVKALAMYLEENPS